VYDFGEVLVEEGFEGPEAKNYELGNKIGAGSYGIVYLGKSSRSCLASSLSPVPLAGYAKKESNRSVAIKILSLDLEESRLDGSFPFSLCFSFVALIVVLLVYLALRSRGFRRHLQGGDGDETVETQKHSALQ